MARRNRLREQAFTELTQVNRCVGSPNKIMPNSIATEWYAMHWLRRFRPGTSNKCWFKAWARLPAAFWERFENPDRRPASTYYDCELSSCVRFRSWRLPLLRFWQHLGNRLTVRFTALTSRTRWDEQVYKMQYIVELYIRETEYVIWN